MNEVAHFQTVDSYVRLEAQRFPEYAVFHQGGERFHITCAVRTLLGEMFPNSSIGRYGPTGWLPKITWFNLTGHFLLGIREGSGVRDFCT